MVQHDRRFVRDLTQNRLKRGVFRNIIYDKRSLLTIFELNCWRSSGAAGFIETDNREVRVPLAVRP